MEELKVKAPKKGKDDSSAIRIFALSESGEPIAIDELMTEIAANSSTTVMQLYDWQGTTANHPTSSSYIDPDASFWENILDKREGRKRSIFV